MCFLYNMHWCKGFYASALLHFWLRPSQYLKGMINTCHKISSQQPLCCIELNVGKKKSVKSSCFHAEWLWKSMESNIHQISRRLAPVFNVAANRENANPRRKHSRVHVMPSTLQSISHLSLDGTPLAAGNTWTSSSQDMQAMARAKMNVALLEIIQ